MLKEVLHTPLDIDGERFTLAEVSYFHRIHELEFDFPVSEFTARSLNHLSRPGRTVRVKELGEVEGMLNGKIDLFFAHDGKYYILDWKSNYLGDRIEDYAPEKIAEAMNEGNYHLQYLLYTKAVRKYLALRDPGFRYETNFGGVIYLFLRGIRQGQPHGIFALKPEAEWLEELDAVLEGGYPITVKGIEVESRTLIPDR
jgi:exodeoxyribonuclease V beta subunit